MPKKTTFESKGFVRRIMKGGLFSSTRGIGDELSSALPNEGKKWRPRKNQFERLEGDDDDSLSAAFHNSDWNIQKTFSTESETGDYKREILYGKKTIALKEHQKRISSTNDRKREFSPIKPPVKDTIAIRAATSSAKKVPKKQKRDLDCQDDLFSDNRKGTHDDPFFDTIDSSGSFGFHRTNDRGNNNNATSRRNGKSSYISHQDEDSLMSRQTSSSRKTSSSRHPYSSYVTVSSDPTDFFSKEQTTKLTMNNLAKMTAMADSPGIDLSGTANKGKDGMKNPLKEQKFYQFAIDEDKASTVVESTFQLLARYETDDNSEDEEQTEYSSGQTSQGTKIQQRSGAPQSEGQHDGHLSFFSLEKETAEDIVSCSSPVLTKNNNEDKDFDPFFSENDTDNFFPTILKTEKTQSVDISFEDPFLPQQELIGFQSDQNRQLRQDRQVSTKSLSYSASPEHKKKTAAVVPKNGRHPRKNCLPLTMNKDISLPLLDRSIASGNYQMKERNKKSFPMRRVHEQDADFQLDAFAQPKTFTDERESKRKIRDSSSLSSNFQLPPTNHFGSPPLRMNVHENYTTNMQDKDNAKENFVVKTNQGCRSENSGGTWGMNNQKKLPFREEMSYGNNDENDDDDSFDSVALWEIPPTGVGKGIESQKCFNQSSKLLADSNDDKNVSPYGSFKPDPSLRPSYNRPNQNHYRASDVNDDDNRSESRSSVSGSYTKPLALPSNAIMASMLFRTHYDVDKDDVEEKLKAHEEENSRQKESRHRRGKIPDNVAADHDYMSTVSSFSDGTSAYMQETWRKPSRDLLNYFSSARTLDMNYPSTKRSQQIRRPQAKQSEGLFEA